MTENRPSWTTQTKLIVILLLLALAIYLLYQFSAAIQPLIMASVLAFVLLPLANWFQKRFSVRRGLATLMAYLVALLIIIAIPLILIPPLSIQSANLNLDIQRFLTEIEKLLDTQYTIAGQTLDIQAIFQSGIGSLQRVIEPVFGQTIGYAIEAISSLVWVIFILVVSFYLVLDSSKLGSWLESITPSAFKQDFIVLRGELNQIWSAFFRGQIILASVVAIIFTVIGFIIGLPFALAMGVIAGLLEFLPSFGHGIWLITASFLAIFLGSTWMPIPNWVFTLFIIGLHIFFQQFDLNYLIPRIIGSRVHLHPLVVILGIVTGALLAGVLGILLAAPTIASARVLGRYIYANLLDQDPFPTAVATPLPPPNPRWWKKSSSDCE